MPLQCTRFKGNNIVIDDNNLTFIQVPFSLQSFRKFSIPISIHCFPLLTQKGETLGCKTGSALTHLLFSPVICGGSRVRAAMGVRCRWGEMELQSADVSGHQGPDSFAVGGEAETPASSAGWPPLR